MGTFLAEIGNTGLLTKEQEVELTIKAKVRAGTALPWVIPDPPVIDSFTNL